MLAPQTSSILLGAAMLLTSVSATPTGALERRFDLECQFERQLTLGTHKLSKEESDKEGCLAWVHGTAATCKPWSKKHLDDLKEVVKQQATKDGQFKDSKVGIWQAGFELLSTAVADRAKFSDKFNLLLDATPKDLEGGKWDQGYSEWRYRYDGDAIWIKMDTDEGLLGTSGCPDQ